MLGGIAYAVYNVIIFDWGTFNAFFLFIFGIPICAIVGAIPGALLGAVTGAILLHSNDSKKAAEEKATEDALASTEKTLISIRRKEDDLVAEYTELERESTSIEVELSNTDSELYRLECDIRRVDDLITMLTKKSVVIST